MLGFEMAQNVLQPVLDPSEIAGAVIGRRFEPFEQIGYALFEMGEGGGAVIADRHAVDAVGQRPQRDLQMFRIFGRGRPIAAFQRRRQCGDALFEDRERIAMAFEAAKLVDLGRQQAHVVAEPRQASLDATLETMERSARDGVFELMDRRGVVVGAQDQVELGAKIADRLVVAGELFCGGQRAQHFANFA